MSKGTRQNQTLTINRSSSLKQLAKSTMSKLLTVFGATGNQGGSVIKAVLADAVLSRDFKIRGITRNVSKPAAQALAARGVQVVAVCSSHASLEAQGR